MSPVAARTALTAGATSAAADGAVCLDAELVAATRAGDADAYGELYRRHVRRCWRLARRLCGSSAAADDVVSDVFANTLRAIQAGCGPRGSFDAYVLRAVRRQANRSRTRGDGCFADAVEPAALEPLSGAVEHGRLGVDEVQVVCDAFGRLPRRFRHVLWLVEVEEHPYAQVADQLGLSTSAVATLVQRARDRFCRTYLEEHTVRSAPAARCRPTRERLASYVRGSLRESSRRRVEEHISVCGDCAAVVDEMGRLDVSLRSVGWAGVVAASRWGALFGRAGMLGGELARMAATVAVGAAAIAGPTADLGTFDDAAQHHAGSVAAAPLGWDRPADVRPVPVSDLRSVPPPVSSAAAGRPADAPAAPPVVVPLPSPVVPPASVPAGASGPQVAPGAGSVVSDVPAVEPAAGEGDGREAAGPAGTEGALIGANVGGGLAVLGVGTSEALVEANVAGGLIDASVGAVGEIAHLGVGDGLVDATVGTDGGELVEADVAGGLLDATVGSDTGVLADVDASLAGVDVVVEVGGLEPPALSVGPVAVDTEVVGETLDRTDDTVGGLLGRLLGD